MGVEAYLLRNQDNAEAVLSWIRRSPMSRVIHDMAVGTTPISLRVVAELPATGATGYLAALLMESGVVPAENFERLRLEAWERDFFATFPDPSTRSLLHRYAAWVVNPRFSAPAGTGAGDDGRRLQASKTHLHLVAAFLDTLQNQGWELTTVPQRIFDNYVAGHGRAGLELTPFIRWARTQHLTRLRSDYLQSHPRGPVISEDQRWAWVAELLHTEELPLPARVSGLLVLLYGATLTRLVSLPREAVTLEDTTTWITLGTDPIQLPDKIGRLLRRLLDTATPHVGEGSTWLFPGARPGRHLTTAALTAPLARRGINLQAGKSAALITLAREVPPSVLADLLGLSLEATTRWSALAGHDWTSYPVTRLMATDSPE
ncbi:phage integrase family protein [Kocuria flava]|uniref:phage integrase family protein n=1 Tax=Kocuria flava TaxID=446860 RepID=UPI00117D6A2D|nr:phage integrase family protein [Kocuria flava]